MFKNYIAVSCLLISTASFAQIDLKNLPASEPIVSKSEVSLEKKLSSGVVVKHTKLGEGGKPVAGSTVDVHYRGYFKNNQEFDSSYKRGATISFPLANVTPCWTEGMQELAEGGKATLFCPSNTAYGSRGAPGAVPPNTDLYFAVELVKIKK